jgi:hypothetical protein
MMDKARLSAFKKLNIPAGNKTILCLDGGGIRGILTIQLLKKLEEVAGIPCYELFDFVAGTSTGGIISGLIATGHDAKEIETIYDSFVKPIFTQRIPILSGTKIFIPKFDKKHYRDILFKTLNNITLEEACEKTGIDLLINSKDIKEGEETFFSYFRKREENFYGGVFLRAVMEATMSAPTYFHPFERFVDGGVTTFNNPSLAAIMEACSYGPMKSGKFVYNPEKLTVFSFGTGCSLKSLQPKDAMDFCTAIDWLGWLMDENSDDSSDMQTYFLRSGLMKGLQYRRFQSALSGEDIETLLKNKLPACSQLVKDQLQMIKDGQITEMDMADINYYEISKVLGELIVEEILKAQKRPFSEDLLDPKTGKDLLITRDGKKAEILENFKNPSWIDSLES